MSSSDVRVKRVRRRVVCCLALVVPALVAALSPVPAQEWPGFRGPRSDGSVAGELPDGSSPLRLKTRWKVPIGSGYTGLSVAEGTLVTAFAVVQERTPTKPSSVCSPVGRLR